MKFSQKMVPFVFLSPFLVLFVIFRAWPIISSVLLSFQELKGIGAEKYIGLENYINLFADKRFVSSLKITSYFTIGALFLLTTIPLFLAILLFKKKTPFRNVWRTIIFLPSLTSLVVVGVVFRLILADQAGLLNNFLGLFGISPIKWLLTAELTIPSLIILALWRWTGMHIIYFSSGLSTIPPAVYEAAEIDGAKGFSLFRHITLPMLKPIVIFVVTISMISGYQVFVEPYVLYSAGRTPGGSGLTTVLYLYRLAFRNFNLGYASALGVVLALIILSISIVQLRLFGFFKKSKS
jgi:arabinosaccharide transport system permease protein